jgi:tetratricopeptide (TPR) repeat protein
VELSHADQIALQRAEGWLELRRPLEASEELDSIEPELRAHPAVLKLRYGIHVAAKQWDMALQLADALARLLPADPFGATHKAIALHKLGRTAEAKRLSLEAVVQFPEAWPLTYNLACFCAALGEIEEARAWLKRALDADGDELKLQALNDPDLAPVWSAPV